MPRAWTIRSSPSPPNPPAEPSSVTPPPPPSTSPPSPSQESLTIPAPALLWPWLGCYWAGGISQTLPQRLVTSSPGRKSRGSSSPCESNPTLPWIFHLVVVGASKVLGDGFGGVRKPQLCIFSLLPHRQCWMLISFSSLHRENNFNTGLCSIWKRGSRRGES